jgi:predicted dehydrogenase
VTTAVRPTRVGLVGCGDVTGLYLPNVARYGSIELAACADLDPGRAAALAERGGFPAVAVDAIMADPTIEIALVLTPPAAHAAVSRAAIAAGKHVYSEKPLATTRDDARAILDDAAAAGVRVGAAPDTFLGGGIQTARALIDEGAIGTPIAATAAVAHLGPESWHPNPGIFYARGGGPLLDVGPYYVTALVSLLGPIASVSAVGRGVGSERHIGSGPLAGGSVTAEVPTTVVATLGFGSGVVGGLVASFDVVGSQAPHFEIHGTEGSLILGDPNRFDGEVRYRPLGADDGSAASRQRRAGVPRPGRAAGARGGDALGPGRARRVELRAAGAARGGVGRHAAAVDTTPGGSQANPTGSPANPTGSPANPSGSRRTQAVPGDPERFPATPGVQAPLRSPDSAGSRRSGPSRHPSRRSPLAGARPTRRTCRIRAGTALGAPNLLVPPESAPARR